MDVSGIADRFKNTTHALTFHYKVGTLKTLAIGHVSDPLDCSKTTTDSGYQCKYLMCVRGYVYIRIHPLCPLHRVISSDTYSMPLSEAHRVIQGYSISMIME